MRYGRPLAQWPPTVAVVAYGNKKYDEAMMYNGPGSRYVSVRGPSDLPRWAVLNGLRCVNWDLLAWLPNNPEFTLQSPYQSTGLSGSECWDSVLLEPLAKSLIGDI